MKEYIEYFLMLETDQDDRFITESTLQELDIPVVIHFISSSTELFPFLEAHPRPRLILLNSNSLPDDGLTVLKALKTSPYSGIPVVVLSDSAAPEEITTFYQEGAISFIEKPSTIELTRQKIKNFFDYWLIVAEV